jgi:hypothetical protein
MEPYLIVAMLNGLILYEGNFFHQSQHKDAMETTLTLYDPDLPIHMKDGMVLLKQTVKNIEEDMTDFEKLSNIVVSLDRELTHGLNCIKTHGYVTEGMANGDKTPDWVPIKKEQAIKEAMDFLKNDPNLRTTNDNLDKRSKRAFTEEEWEERKMCKKEKAAEKKKKIEEYDTIVEELESYKEKARCYKQKFLKCKAYFLAQNIEIPE